ncbi:hypothetical protein HanRHA438_Chr16g0765471 [Helianthus annuus]|nr:hypothetical protein HanRHA438_Chr16g0765471 [Helianthus annuus]
MMLYTCILGKSLPPCEEDPGANPEEYRGGRFGAIFNGKNLIQIIWAPNLALVVTPRACDQSVGTFFDIYTMEKVLYLFLFLFT